MMGIVDKITEMNKEGRVFKILGPCSCSSEQEIYENARMLSERFQFDFFRVGLWKPRTRPSQFEGIGSSGLETLSRIERELNVRTCTEVGTLSQLEEFLKWRLSGLWIGARTTQASLVIEEIADRLADEKYRPTVFIKNPVSGCADAFFGAIERFKSKGIKDIVLIIRGVSMPIGKSEYRNLPGYSILRRLMSEYPELPFLIDPSHIAGERGKLLNVYNGFRSFSPNGVMIETHYNPSASLTDKDQILNHDQLEEFLASIEIISNDSTELSRLRKELDDIDSIIIGLLNKRFELVNEVGDYKMRNRLSVYDESRKSQILLQGMKLSNEKHKEFFRELFEQIHEYSCKLQTKSNTIKL